MAELDRQIAEEKATIEGKTRVSEWRAAKRYLLDLDMDKLWAEATIGEQREALSIFRSITATPEGLAFEVPDLAVGFEIALQTARSAVVEVAGPDLNQVQHFRPPSRRPSPWCSCSHMSAAAGVAEPGLVWSADIPFRLVTVAAWSNLP